jgi:serine protease Do
MSHRLARDFGRRSLELLCPGLIAAAFLAWLAVSAARASELRRTPTVKLVQQARPSIVNIHGQKTLGPGEDGFRRGETQNVNGMGTGVVIDERGYILTNHHVVDGVKKIEVTLADKQEYIGTRISHDPKTDLAIIKINVPRKLPVIKTGTSNDLMPGESVVAVGNAYGYEHTVTRGIISALHRTVRVSDSQDYKDLIQTDASINPGNSGGPLLNIDGEMIGINVAVRAGAQGIGFAIPVDMAMGVAADLMSAQHNTWHGIVSKQSGTQAVTQCVIKQVDEESPAAKCGLQPGDVIASVGESPVARALDLERALLGHRPGEEIALSVERNKKPVTVNLTLAAAPKRVNDPDRIWDTLGLRLTPATASQLKGYQKQYRGGLLVTEVRADSPSFREGIHRGDILLGMHIWETISLENVNYILKNSELSSLQPLKFLILRNDVRYEGALTVSMRKQARDR